MKATDLAIEDPAKGLPVLWEHLSDARSRGDTEAIHGLGDVLLPLLIHQRADLERAEKLAHELIAQLPDRVHFSLLAQVYEAQGRVAESLEVEAKANVAPDLHTDAETRRIIDEVAEEHQSRRK